MHLHNTMRLRGLHSNPYLAASLHSDDDLPKAALDACRATYAALEVAGHPVCASAPTQEGHGSGDLPPYRAKPDHLDDPTVLWVAACQAHFVWTLDFATALAEEYKSRYGHAYATERHMTHIRGHLRRNGWPSASNMALGSISAGAWYWKLSKGSTQEAEERAERRVSLPQTANTQPPLGCEFGLTAIGTNDSSLDKLNWQESHRRSYGRSIARAGLLGKAMTWSRGSGPDKHVVPAELAAGVLAAVQSGNALNGVSDDDLLVRRHEREQKKRKREGSDESSSASRETQL